MGQGLIARSLARPDIGAKSAIAFDQRVHGRLGGQEEICCTAIGRLRRRRNCLANRQNMLYSGQLEPGPEAIGPIAPRTALNHAGAMNPSARLASALAGLDLRHERDLAPRLFAGECGAGEVSCPRWPGSRTNKREYK